MNSINQTLALSTLLIASCFNAGPPGTKPSGATAVFSIAPQSPNNDCNETYYIGSVAIGDVGSPSYLSLVPYVLQSCSNSGGNGSSAHIISFDTNQTTIFTASSNGGGGMPPPCGMNGNTSGLSGSLAGVGATCADSGGSAITPPRLLAGGQWVAGSGNTTGGSLLLGRPGNSAVPINNVNGSVTPASVVFDASSATVFVAGWPQTSSASDRTSDFYLEEPEYPGQSSAFSRTSSQGSYVLLSAPANGTGAIDPTTLSQSIQFFGESVENSLVGNVDTLFFISHSVITPGGATLGSFPKTGTSNTQPIAITELDESFSANAGPVGLAASDTALVWVESVDVHSYPEVGCQVFYLPLPLTAPVTGISPIFSTKKFSCMDAALDTNGDIYFAIVSLDADANEMHGDGIGRVQTHGSEFNSIALGIVGEGAGPRRLYLDGASIYAVDPQVIGKIAKSSLDGQHDFSAE